MSGAVYSLAYVSLMPDVPSIGASFSAEGEISDYPRARLSSSVIKVATPHGLVIATVPPFPELRRGDRVNFDGVVSLVRGRRIYLNYPEIEKSESAKIRMFDLLGGLRGRLLGNLSLALPADNAALAAGLLLGDDSGFSREFKADLKRTGTLHVVALSGWNIAIIISVFGHLARLVFRRYFALIFSGAGIIFLILLAGPSASLIRAAIMGFVFIFASLIGREYSPRNAIFFAAAVMTAFDPSAPAYDLGFQLSFLAVLGMVYIAPVLSSRFEKMKFGRLLTVSGFSDSLAAQMAILPAALLGAVTLSPVGLLANAAILFLIPCAFFLSLVVAILGTGAAALSWISASGANAVLSYEINAIHLLGNLF